MSPVRRWWLVGSAAALLASLLLAVVAATPWPLLFVALGLLTLVVGQWSSWPFAFAASVGAAIGMFAILVRLTPWSGIGLDLAGLIALVVVGLPALAVIRFRSELRLPGTEHLTLVAPVAIVAGVVGVAGLALVAAGELAWAMNSDAVWNLVAARFVANEQGLRPDLHPNASPLTTSLLAMAISAGRGGVDPAELLRHDVANAGELWMVLLAISVALAALIGLRATRDAPTWLRTVAAVATGLLPASWYMFGWAAFFGFYNATVTIVILLVSWIAWLEARSAPILASTVLSIATVTLLATWAPLAAIPVALAVAALVWRLCTGARARRKTVLWWLVVMLPVPIYLALFTLPDLARQGSALVADGGIVNLGRLELILSLLVASVVVVGYAIVTRSFQFLVGYGVVVLSAGIGIGYLMIQRVHEGADSWGYYPIKMAWLSAGLLVVIFGATVFAAFARLQGRRRVALTATFVAVALVGGALAPDPPISRPLFVNMAILTNPLVKPLSDGAASSRVVFELARPGEHVLAARLVDPDTDRRANLWLLRLDSKTGNDPIDRYAYYLDPENAAEICDAVGAWTGEVTIHTSDPALEDSLRETCPEADIEVVVHGD